MYQLIRNCLSLVYTDTDTILLTETSVHRIGAKKILMGLLSSSNITMTMKFQVNLRRSAFCLPQNAETIMTVLCHQTYKLHAKDAKQAKANEKKASCIVT